MMAGAITWNYDKYGTPPAESNKLVQGLEDFNKKQSDTFDSLGRLADKFLNGFDWITENWKIAIVGAIAVLLLVRRL